MNWETITRPIGNQVYQLLIRMTRSEDVYVVRKEDPIRTGFIDAFDRRSRSYGSILITLVALFTINIFLSWSINFQLYALVFTFLGSLVIARGLIKGKRGIWRRSVMPAKKRAVRGSSWGSELDVEPIIISAHESVDGLWGALFLTIGFSLHIIMLLEF